MKGLFLATLFTFLAGCENHTGETWHAQKAMPVYRSPEGDAQKAIFQLEAGDVCYPGRVVVAKVYQYTEVDCPPKGKGWVADDYFDKSR